MNRNEALNLALERLRATSQCVITFLGGDYHSCIEHREHAKNNPDKYKPNYRNHLLSKADYCQACKNADAIGDIEYAFKGPMKLEYKPLYVSSSAGGRGTFGLNIEVAGSHLPDLEDKRIWSVAYEASSLLERVIRTVGLESDPDALAQRQAERAQILGCFDQAVFVEEIPNGYCSDWCCTQLPWFIVTTNVGRIKIGWRKRVILIEWDQTIGTKTSNELFPNEDVTKGERMIHAWGAAKAKEYVSAIIASGGGAPALPAPPEQKLLQ